MIRRRWILLNVLIILMLLLMAFGNQRLGFFMEKTIPYKKSLFPDEALSDKGSLSPRETLRREDPQRFGIVVQSDNSLSRNQTQWDYDMRKTFLAAEIIQKMDAASRIIDFEESEAEYLKRVNRIEGRITYYEKRKKESALDPALDEKLQQLYMLKATLTVFKDRILIDHLKKK